MGEQSQTHQFAFCLERDSDGAGPPRSIPVGLGRLLEPMYIPPAQSMDHRAQAA